MINYYKYTPDSLVEISERITEKLEVAHKANPSVADKVDYGKVEKGWLSYLEDLDYKGSSDEDKSSRLYGSMILERKNKRLLEDNANLQARIASIAKAEKELEQIKSTRTYKLLRVIGLLK